MARKIKYGKVTIVVLITVLIWVWADLAQDDTLTVPNVTIRVAKSIRPSLWVTFADNQSSVSIEEIVLKGPASRIAEEDRRLREGETLEFDFDPVKEKMDKPDSYTFTLLPFLQRNKIIRQLGLTVESCEPETISVNVVKLAEKPLKVRCIDQDGIAIKDATIDPTHVKMFVPEDWAGGKLIADVLLTLREIAHARAAVIDGTPQIELAPGQVKKAQTIVKIKMPPEENPLSERTITAATLAIGLSVNLQGKYKVDVTNHTEVVRPFTIRATLEAKQAYERQPFQITLYILDGDEKVEGEQTREVVYNLPEEFVRKDQIMPPTLPVQAKFKLILLPPGEGPPAAGS